MQDAAKNSLLKCSKFSLILISLILLALVNSGPCFRVCVLATKSLVHLHEWKCLAHVSIAIIGPSEVCVLPLGIAGGM